MTSLFQKILTEKGESPEQKRSRQIALVKKIEAHTNRYFMAYIANFHNKQSLITPFDKSNFVHLINSIPADDKPLDFILHSPGGYAEAVEMIVVILRSRFDDIRFIIPHTAKSAGTMLALSGNEILLKSSAELGPIDPQVDGPISGPAIGILDGFEEIKESVRKEKELNGAFIPLLEKMDISLLKLCEAAKKYSENLVTTFLKTYMLKDTPNNSRKARNIAKYFSNYNFHLTHGKPITFHDINNRGLNVKLLESADNTLDSFIWEYFCRWEPILNISTNTAKIFQTANEFIVNQFSEGQQMIPISIPPGIIPPGMPPTMPPKTPAQDNSDQENVLEENPEQ